MEHDCLLKMMEIIQQVLHFLNMHWQSWDKNHTQLHEMYLIKKEKGSLKLCPK